MTNRIAVLIDAENISYKYTNDIFKAIGNDGDIVAKKAYGDFSNPCLLPWKDTTLNHAIEAVQRFSYSSGKSSSDSAMNIDAMDMLYNNTADCFVIVSSDSDFTNLAIRLRNDHKKVIGIGEKKASESFKLACDEYKCIETLVEKSDAKDKTYVAGSAEKPNKTSDVPLSLIKKDIGDIIDQKADKYGRVMLAKVATELKNKYPDFDYRAYGDYRKMQEFVASFAEFELIKDTSYKPALNFICKKSANSTDVNQNAGQGDMTVAESVVSTPVKTVLYCSNCGAKLIPGAKFCGMCGTAVCCG